MEKRPSAARVYLSSFLGQCGCLLLRFISCLPRRFYLFVKHCVERQVDYRTVPKTEIDSYDVEAGDEFSIGAKVPARQLHEIN